MGVKRNLTSGPRLDTAHLTRVPLGDGRIFAKRSIPAKRDWAVTIGLDCSGSTGYNTSSVIKNGGYAMAELLSSLGIPFSMYGHTGRYTGDYGSHGRRLTLELFHVKKFEEPWDNAAKQRCLQLRGSQANLDGHSLEFYRRDLQSRRSTDKLIMYFTDGEMPAENYDEELRLLQKNIKVCSARNIKLVGVGVGTEAPRKHGLDTIRYDSIKDLPKLITELGKRLAE
jgi:cobalamin biosynthesis protein CobT